MSFPTTLPATLRALEESPWGRPPLRGRSVRDEIRENLLRAIAGGEELFAGVHGYEDTVLPQIVNALLARHDFILLGLRGQAKSRRSEERRVGKECRSGASWTEEIEKRSR